MGNSDRLIVGVPQGAYKRDFNLYQGAGAGGGGSATVSGTQRQTYFMDYSPYAVYLREVIFQNANFNIWTNSGLTTKAPLYFGISNSNDYPTDRIIARAAGQGLQFPATAVPPYNVRLTNLIQPNQWGQQILGQPEFVEYYADQGGYLYFDAYVQGNTYGNNNQIVQSFVPTSPRLLMLNISSLFVGTISADHTQYKDQVLEIWDSNKSVIYSQTISRFAHPFTGKGYYNWDLIDYENDFTADDGQSYWTNLVGVKFPCNLSVVPGQTYYFCIRGATNGTTNLYGITANTNASFAVDTANFGNYINGQGYFAFWGGTTLTPFADGRSFGFLTVRDKARLAVTVCWDSPSYYWYNPSSFLNQILFTKLSQELRI